MKSLLSLVLVSAFGLMNGQAFAQSENVVPVVKANGYFKTSGATWLTVASGGGCSEYTGGCAQAYSLIATSLEAAQYLASLPDGLYNCDAYYGQKEDDGTKIFSPKISCVRTKF